MRIRTAVSCIIASLLAVSKAQAASPLLVEVVRPKALLQLDGLEQSVSFLYGYSGVKTASMSSSSHQFQESYRVDTAWTVLDPSLLQLGIGANLGFDQSFGSHGGGSQGLNYDYSISANALQFDPYPISATSSRSTTQVSTAYLPTYTTVTNSNQLWLRLRNKVIPLVLRYNRTSLDTEGLDQDSSTTNNSLSLEGSHNWRDISTSELSLNYNGSHAQVSGQGGYSSSSYGITGSNTLSFDKARRYTLGSSFNVSQSKQGDIPQTAANLTENLTAVLGKTLQGRAVYQHDYNKTVAGNGLGQEQNTDSISGSLSHQLFESLTTNVNGSFQNRDLSGGEEQAYGGGAGLSYQKRLPAKSQLRLGFSGNRNYIERSGSVSVLTVWDELHRSVNQGDLITLTTPGNLREVTKVRSHNPERTYVEGVDYDVNLPLSRIEIRTAAGGGTVLPGTDLYISYTVKQNAALKYYTDSAGVSAGLSLLENRYVFSGDYSIQTQNLISGRADTLSLYDTTMFHLRFDGNFQQNVVSTEYGNADSGESKYSYWSGAWRYIKRFSTADVSLNMQDRYTISESADAKTTAQNTFDVGGNFSRSLYRWARMSLSANYSNTTGDNGNGNFIFFRGNLIGRLNLLQFSLTGQTGLRISKGETTRNDSLIFLITRTFR